MKLYVDKINSESEMTIRKLCENCLAKSIYNKFGYGKDGPSLCELCRLAESLDVSVGSLFGCDPIENEEE